MLLSMLPGSTALKRHSTWSGAESIHCRSVSTHATDFEAYVLDLQSSIKAEAERLEADSGNALKFQDDRCGPN